MNIRTAAAKCRYYIDYCDLLPEEHNEIGKDHLHDMIDKIVSEKVSGNKGHRWLGYIQGCICASGGAGLEEMKLINKES